MGSTVEQPKHIPLVEALRPTEIVFLASTIGLLESNQHEVPNLSGGKARRVKNRQQPNTINKPRINGNQ